MFQNTMTNILVVVAFFFFVILFIIGLLWVLVPAMYGLPSRPTHPDRIRAALKLANLKADELLYDLDSGDGRVLVLAAREFGAKVVGWNVLFSWRRLLKNFIRIVKVHIDDAILNADKRHHIDADKWNPLIMSFCEFYGLGTNLHTSRLAKVF
jgi:hypothetical protein